jgi:hypothetical protein
MRRTKSSQRRNAALSDSFSPKPKRIGSAGQAP